MQVSFQLQSNNQGISSKEITDTFLKDLSSFKEGPLSILSSIFDNNLPKKLKLRVYQCKQIPSVYILMVQCYNDKLLLNLGNIYQFPRGFPILYIPGKEIKTWGFYPKFDNDGDLTSEKPIDFKNLKSIKANKKWSGFLGQLMSFTYQGNNYWFTTSKNSASDDSEFVKDVERLFNPFINDELIQEMIDQNIHICAEMMSHKDQIHGARVLKETPVVTCVAQGIIANITSKNVKTYSNNFNHYWSHLEQIKFCLKHSLPCDSAYILKDVAAENFMKELSLNRDLINNSMFDQFVEKNSELLELILGNISHQEVLGNTLEGLVINIEYNDGSKLTKKFKLAQYTHRTMCIRNLLSDDKMRVNLQAFNQFKRFGNRWCINESGKQYWIKKLAVSAMILEKDSDHTFAKIKDVGLHIQLADYVSNLSSSDTDSLFDEFMQKVNPVINSIFDATVIIAVGPIGSGKSSVIQKLAESNTRYQNIDGDLLSFENIQEVLSLSQERNVYTQWLILQSIMKGKIPCISTGGGALYTSKGYGKNRTFEFNLLSQVQNILGIKLKVILLLPSDNIDQITIYDKFVHNIHNSYQSESTNMNIHQTVRNRLKSGSWTLADDFYPKVKGKKLQEVKKSIEYTEVAIEKMCSKISDISRNNLHFALDLASNSANKIYVFPNINQENYDQIINNLCFDSLESDIVNPPSGINSGNFSQIRLLVKKPDNKYHHITVAYSSKGELIRNYQYFDLLNNQIKQLDNSTGVQITVKGHKDGKYVKPCSFIMVNDLENLIKSSAAHITLNSGPHSASKIRDLTLAIRANESFVTIDGVNYDLTQATTKSVVTKIHQAFAI